MVILKIVFTEKEKVYVDKLAEIMKFPLDDYVSSDGYTIYLPQKVIIQHLYELINEVNSFSKIKRQAIRDRVIEKIDEYLPDGVVKK